MKILNLTQHQATPAQIQAGVYEPKDKEFVKYQLTFTKLPSADEIVQKALNLAYYAKAENASHVMIGGALYLMSALENVLKDFDIVPLYAFSERVCVETHKEDGTVIKTNEFVHVGFVEV